jgi:hypothetical protein
LIGKNPSGDKMGTTEMELKVALALRARCLEIFGTTWNNEDTMALARAAIRAMREPTQEMIDAPWFVMDEEHTIKAGWEDMIDAASPNTA